MKNGPIEDWEIEKAHNGARRDQANQVTSTLQRAVQLGEYAMFFNDPGLINTRTDKILKVTAADVQRVARSYLVDARRSVVHVVPAPATPAVAEGGR